MIQMDDALALTRLVDIEARMQVRLSAAVAAGDCIKAAHFQLRLDNIDRTIDDRALGIFRIF